ncbi:MAG: hypothetical protein P4M09_23820 [Devosia sp.]|nr:hypothetical protein [Devosia sp.]
MEGLAKVGVDRGARTKTEFVVAAIIFVLLTLCFLAAFGPFVVGFIQPGLDASWVAASTFAQAHRLDFGTDFIFTSGPFSSLYHRGYAYWFTPVVAATMVSLSLYCGFAVTRLIGWEGQSARGRIMTAALVLLLTASLQSLSRDILLFSVPLFAALLVISGKSNAPLTVLGGVGSAAVTLSKFSAFPFALGAALLSDLVLLTRRRWPVATPTLFAASFALFAVSGQRLEQYPAFLVSELDVAGTYAPAMGYEAKNGELLIFLPLAAVAALAVAWLVRAEYRKGRPLVEAIALWCLFTGLIYVAIKAGFVRHDLHSLIGWTGLWLGALVYALPGISPRVSRRNALVLVALAILLLPAMFVFRRAHKWPLTDLSPVSAVLTGWDQATAGVEAFANPGRWLAALAVQEDRAAGAVRAAEPLPKLEGTVDVIPDRQSAVIAAGLDYDPRPNIQEYSTYSDRMFAQNRQFFESARAPDYLLFAPGSIDGRHPASAEGALWPLFLERYAQTGRAGDMLVLRQRQTPLPNVLGPEVVQTGLIGQPVTLPAGDQPVFVKIDIRESLLGKLMDAALKPPMIMLDVTYRDGTGESFRLIPGQIRSGMVLSPTITTANDYALFARAGDIAGMRFPVAFRVETSALGQAAYQPELSISIAPIDRRSFSAPSQ